MDGDWEKTARETAYGEKREMMRNAPVVALVALALVALLLFSGCISDAWNPPKSQPRCGDGECISPEDALSCPQDCGTCTDSDGADVYTAGTATDDAGTVTDGCNAGTGIVTEGLCHNNEAYAFQRTCPEGCDTRGGGRPYCMGSGGPIPEDQYCFFVRGVTYFLTLGETACHPEAGVEEVWTCVYDIVAGKTKFEMATGGDCAAAGRVCVQNDYTLLQANASCDCSDVCEGVCGGADCYGYDPDCDSGGADTGACCGNIAIDAGEECDGPDLGGKTCVTKGFDGGTLGCAADCTFDTSGCWQCGNGIQEPLEDCDGADLAGETCITQGFDGGTLACTADCSAFDWSGCTTCGNAICETGETAENCSEDCQPRIIWHYYSYIRYSSDIRMCEIGVNCGAGDVKTQVTTDTEDQKEPAIHGNTIVWQDGRYGGAYEIYMYDLGPDNIYGTADDGGESRVTSEAEHQWHPAIHGNKIVWWDWRNQQQDIYMCEIGVNCGAGDVKTRVTTDTEGQSYPAIHGNIIVWTDSRNPLGDIYMYDLGQDNIYGTADDGGESRVTSDPAIQAGATIHGNKIVWSDWRDGNSNVYMYDLGPDNIYGTADDGGESRVTSEAEDQQEHAIYGTTIVWRDTRADLPGMCSVAPCNWDIYMYDLGQDNIYGTADDGGESQVTSDTGRQWCPAIHEDTIVWLDNRNDIDGYDEDIYMCEIGVNCGAGDVKTRVTSVTGTIGCPKIG